MEECYLHEWCIEDHLKTAEARAAYIEAVSEDGTPAEVASSIADVLRSIGKKAAAKACEVLTKHLETAKIDAPAGAVRGRARKRRREMATA